MKSLNSYIIEKLKIDKDSGTIKTVQDRFKILKNLTVCALGLQEWHSKDFYVRLTSKDLFTVHFKCEISETILKRVWKYLYDEFKDKDLIEQYEVNQTPVINGKTLIYRILKDENNK